MEKNQIDVIRLLNNPQETINTFRNQIVEYFNSFFKETKNKPEIEFGTYSRITFNLGDNQRFTGWHSSEAPAVSIPSTLKSFLYSKLRMLRKGRPFNYDFTERVILKVPTLEKEDVNDDWHVHLNLYFPNWEFVILAKSLKGKIEAEGSDIGELLKALAEHYKEIDRFYLDALLKIEKYLLSINLHRFREKKDLVIIRQEIMRMTT